MTDTEWQCIEQQATETWARGKDAFLRPRLEGWHRRFGREPFGVMTQAFEALERDCDFWPTNPRIYRAIEGIKQRLKPRVVAQPVEPTGPLTGVEWRENAEMLEQAAERRGPCAGYLRTLAQFYRSNGWRVDAGDEPLWPPPLISGAMGKALRPVFVDDARE